MRSRTSRALLVFGFLAALSCSSGKSEKSPLASRDGGSSPMPSATAPNCADAAPEGSSGSFFPCEIETIIVAKCQRCHNSDAVLKDCTKANTCEPGPFQLLTWGDTRRDFGRVRPVDRMPAVISSGYMPYQSMTLTTPVEKLTAAEKATMLQWLSACAPPATAGCGDAAP